MTNKDTKDNAVVSQVARRKKLALTIERRISEEGWSSTRQFCLNAGFDLSGETVRKLVNALDFQVEPATLAIILRALNYTHDEIRSMLQEFTDDKDLWPMIGGGKRVFNIYEESVRQAVNTIMDAGKEDAGNLIADQIDIVARAFGVDVSEHTNKIRRKKKG